MILIAFLLFPAEVKADSGLQYLKVCLSVLVCLFLCLGKGIEGYFSSLLPPDEYFKIGSWILYLVCI